MRYTTGFRSPGFDHSGLLPTGVKWLLISNIAVFLLTYVGESLGLGGFFRLFALTPAAVIGHLAVYQLVTYLFLHGGIWHLLVNMFTLWMFGVTLERDWGTRRFVKYYFLCGVGAGICDVLLNAAVGNWGTSTIGASGAIYGLLLAFGVMYPNQMVLFSFLFPIKAKYFVMIYGAIALLSSMQVNSGVSHIAHLGGMLFGLLYLKTRIPSFDLGAPRRAYRQWQLQRAKKKFQVYLRKRGGDRDRWVN
ncbi:MAG TPA: rhomboid family intramembrane serine protease [Bryobacteraceae bacterium]|nr:rhomboid family intramembrane serine protease [Bryobacteraceae bacterium]